MAEGNESYKHIGALKLRETNPTSFRKTRPRESKRKSNLGSRRPREKRHIFLLVLQAKGNESYRNVGTARLREAKHNKFLRNQAEGK